MVRRLALTITVCLFVFAFFASGGAAFAAPEASFGPPARFGSGYVAYSSEVADVNNDGRPDIVMPMYRSGGFGGLRTYLNDGSGGFTLGAASTVSGPDARLADFDRDGDLDAAVVVFWGSYVHNIQIADGDGTGTFTGVGYVDHPYGTNSLEVGDFNGDAVPDLVVLTGDNLGDVFLGDGDGTFTLSGVVGLGQSPFGAAVGDVNRDGKQDFVAANNGDGTLQVVLGDGTGVGLTALPAIPVGPDPRYLILEDFDRDGMTDLAVGYTEGTYVSVFDGDGSGDFSNRRDIPVPVSVTDLTAADVNRDGARDLVVGGVQPGQPLDSESEIRVLLGDGSGNFPVQVAPPHDPGWGYGLTSINAADFGGDGLPDLVTTNRHSNMTEDVAVITNSTTVDHSLEFHMNSVNTVVNASRLAPVDFNRDGKPDIAVASETNGTVGLLLGDGDGGLTDAGTIAGAAVNILGLDVTDFDRDGIPDLLTFDNSAVRFWNISAGGGISLATSADSAGTAAGAAIDSNRDGNPDAVAVNYSTSDSQVFAGAGNGSLTPSTTLDAGSWVTDVAVADFNGDGTQDVATVGGVDHKLYLATGDGDGHFSTTSTGPVTASFPSGIDAGDIDHDGDVDVVLVAGGSLRPLINNGTGSWTAGTVATGTAGDVVLTDFDLDGSLDAVTCGSDGHVTYYDNDGSGSFTMIAWTSAGTALNRITALDLDRDGRPDIAATGGNKVFVLPNDVAAPYTTAVLSPYNPDGSNGWYVTTPTATFVTNEQAFPRYSFNGSDWAVYDGSTLTTFVPGVNSLSFWSIDFPLIHMEATQTLAVKVDTDDPVTTISGLPGGVSWTDVQFTLSAVDPASGVSTRFYRLDGGAPASYTSTVTISADGTTTVGWWSVDNAGNAETEHTATVVINHAEPPVTAPDSYLLSEDGTLLIFAPGVLVNDSDPESGTLTAAQGTAPAHGSGLLFSNGAFTYSPDPDWYGTDTFTYIATNDYLSAVPETVTITVASVPDAPTALGLSNASIAENQPPDTPVGTFTATDVDSTEFTYSLWPSDDASAFAIVGNELRIVAPLDYEQQPTYLIGVHVTDESGEAFDEDFEITVLDLDELPVTGPDSYEATEDVTLNVPAPGVLGNDNDPEGAILYAMLAAAPAHGTVDLVEDGSFTYTSEPDWSGTDTFTYVASDVDLGLTALQTRKPNALAPAVIETVTITVAPVNDPPSSVALSNDAIAENEPAGSVIGTLTTTDLDSTDFTYSLPVGMADNAAFTIDGDQLKTAASFDYESKNGYSVFVCSSDDMGAYTYQTFTIDVTNVLEPPVAAPDSYSTSEDTTLVVPAQGVLANDFDPIAPTFIRPRLMIVGMDAVLTSPPSHGSLVLDASGAFTYTPDPDWSGTDEFMYRARNPEGSSAPETVTITVDPVADAPTALHLSQTWVVENEPVGAVVGQLTADDVDSASFTYSLLPVGDASAFTVVGDELRTAQSFDYETKSSYSITARVTDESDNTFDQAFTIDVFNDNERPMAVPDSYETTEGIDLDVGAPGPLGNDSDPDGNALDMQYVTLPSRGTLTWGSDGSFTYVPEAGFHGTDAFTYCADDGQGKGRLWSTPATVTITVHPADATPPTTTSDATSTYSGEAVINLAATDDIAGVEGTYWRLDGAAAASGTSVHIVTTGVHALEFWSEDNAGNVEPSHTVTFTVTSDIIPIEGADRYGTAIRSSQEAFPSGAAKAVICRGDVWADVSGGSALAGAVDGPLLLTRPGSVSDAVLAELDRLGVSDVYILGDKPAISAGVADTLAAALGGADHVTRIGGPNRYATAALVASETARLLIEDEDYDGKVFLATGEDFPDAIAAAPLAARLHRPILLTRPGSLSAEASEALAAIGQNGVHILGSTTAVSANVASQAAGIVGQDDVARLQGPDRYRTAIAIAEYGVSQGLDWNGVAIGTGTNFPDALAGGVMQGVFNSVVLLTPPDHLHPAVADVLRAHKTEIGFCRILGGPLAVSENTRVQIHDALE